MAPPSRIASTWPFEAAPRHAAQSSESARILKRIDRLTGARHRSLIIPADLVARCEQQMNTPYTALSPDEKRSHLEQVENYLPTVIDLLR